MKKHLCLLVLGLFHSLHGAEIKSDNVGSEAKDIIFRDGTFNPFSYKREAPKITNTDSPSFNYLKSSNSLTSTPSSGGFKPSSPPKVPPLKFIQSNQIQQTTPFLNYFQSAHPATEIAAQYLHVVPVAQYQFQTPNQVQYIASPAVSQYPFIKFQNLGAQYTTSNAGSEASNANAAASSQYLTSTQQTLTSGSSLGTASSNSQASLPSNIPAKQFALQQSSQAVYNAQLQQHQQQQPFYTFYQLQPQAATSNFLYQQPNANYYLSQNPQQFFSFYPAGRFGFYSPVQGTQLFVAPATSGQAQGSPDSTSSNEIKTSSEQKASSTQQATSSTSITFGTKV